MLTSPLLRGGRWTRESRIFISISAIQTVANIAFEAYFISRLNRQTDTSNQTQLYIVYDSGFIAAQIFAFILTYSALHVRSEPLVTAATAFDMLLVLFQVAQITQTGALLGTIAMQAVSISILALGFAGKVWLVWSYLKKEFGWQVYRALGADLKMQRIFFFHQILLSLVTLAAFLFLELWMQLATITVQSHGSEGGGWAQNILILFVCTGVLCMALFSAVQEFCWLMYGCIAVFVISPAFFICKLVTVNRHRAVSDGEDVYAGGRKYMTFILTLLLILDIALVAISFVVSRTFGKGLRQRLRQFQILNRGEVDLELVSRPDPATNPTTGSDSGEKPNQDGEGSPASTIGHGFSGLMNTAKSSIRESPLLFRAFFSGLEAIDTIPKSCHSVRSLHRETVALWEKTAPGVANPQLIDMFDVHRSGTLNPTPTGSPSGVCGSEDNPDTFVTGDKKSRLFDTFTQFGTRSTTQGTLALALSVAELDAINGDGSAPTKDNDSLAKTAAPAWARNLEFVTATTSATPPAGVTKSATNIPTKSTTLSTSTNTSTSAAASSPLHKPRNSEVENYATDCALYNTLQRPLTLRVVNADSMFNCSDEDLASSKPIMGVANNMDTMRSAISHATSADQSALLGEISHPTLLREGFDLTC
ncbi:hypothetical protein BX661DRAFT_13885 [Kickxella alabastrina]|uniref:uncharacterized protein n=1 Tax=Kickxella alabastrina TaxID=61397 RepID=UPI00221E80A3|nr:uncharacterized protein BX661DRAFT_13885 [Kickxella alabastrina]KAI7828407.1 hypothetical protein BX661DRAFT_13885 [Kickxella alabastrina]